MEKEEILYKLAVFEKQIQQIQQQLQLIEQGLNDLNSLDNEIDNLRGKKDKEILAPVSSGIFVKAKLLSEDLIVDVGGKNFVKKSIDETKETIREQIKKLEEVKIQLTNSLDEINKEATEILMKIEEDNSGIH
ncbi:prefoldin subunit alpha [Candidatus Pacearchaeota archaeon]|nr:prefoldin subunit alpha [Candidatus Pacearchaeota archaeon]